MHEGDLGEVRYVRTNDDEAPGTYAGVLDAEYTANPNYDVRKVPARRYEPKGFFER